MGLQFRRIVTDIDVRLGSLMFLRCLEVHPFVLMVHVP